MTVNQRVIKFIEIVSVNKIIELTDIKKSTLYKIASGELLNGPRIGILDELFKAFPNLNESWLIRGEGHMWKKIDNFQYSEMKEDGSDYESQRAQTKEQTQDSDKSILFTDAEVYKKHVDLLIIEMQRLKERLDALEKGKK